MPVDLNLLDRPPTKTPFLKSAFGTTSLIALLLAEVHAKTCGQPEGPAANQLADPQSRIRLQAVDRQVIAPCLRSIELCAPLGAWCVEPSRGRGNAA